MKSNKSNITIFIFVTMFTFLLPLFLNAASVDRTGPQIRWIGPREGMCLKVTASQPSIGVAVEAEDISDVKQGIVWLKPGRHDRVGAISSWSRIWGQTFATGATAPPAVNFHFMVRMLGRGEGEFTLLAEFQDMLSSNTSRSFRYFSIDNAEPLASFIKPENNRVVCKDLPLKVAIAASDSGCGVKGVYLYIDRVSKATFIGSDKISPYEILVPYSSFTQTIHKLVALVKDKAGNVNRISVDIKPERICKMMMKKN